MSDTNRETHAPTDRAASEQSPAPSPYESVPPAPPVPPATPTAGPLPPVPPQAPVYGDTPAPAPGYAQPPAPGYAQPQAPAYGYPPQQTGHPAPGYPAGGYPVGAYPAAVPPRGLLPWALGLLILIPFPFLGGLASGIAMAVSGGASRRFGGVARENARAALNWGLTYLLVSTVLLVSHFVLLFSLTADSPSGFYPIGIPITIYFALSVLHLVLVIIGMVRAAGGKVMRVPFAIPYLRG
ncbi:DUF4870 domain-containing protein [Microbacterium sp. Leaf159]|uniref:DUF4870 domain-containing protein n=1 Tax=Microbacterium sp. Leaf159 TaxID=1736279 RepID=UPI0006F99AB2|nr:DUF4870 domain-containing protein [Microbacterium sp. Leaf159]KQR38881.1 hypothetical protein ASF80_05280 [Microbacterium sp. Leaf159]